MKKIVLITFLLVGYALNGYSLTDESSPSARYEAEPQTEITQVVDQVETPSITEEPLNETPLSPRMKKRMDKVKKIWKKKEEKIKKKLAKRGIKDIDDVSFEDVVVLAGAIVVVLGIVSIIFSPISAIVSVVLGLAVYLIGKGYGGSLDAFF